MDLNERMKNYHWSESDISDWTKEKISQELIKRNYEIITLDVFAKICSRMNSLGLVYIINMDTIRNNKSCVLTNFTSTHCQEIEDFPWFIDFFKELEGQAILQFSKNVIDLEEKERSRIDIPKIQASEKTQGTFQYTSVINCPPDEFKDFLFKKEFIEMWARNLKVEDGFYKIDRIIFKIEVDTLKFKLDEWPSFTKVEINFKDIRGNTKLELKQTGVPLKDLDVMTGLWRENIFMPICMYFGFTERLDDE